MHKWPRHVTVIGVGLIGGSLGLALKARHRGVRVVGIGRRQESLDQARKVGAIDEAHLQITPQAVERAELVVLATPVGAFERHLRDLARLLPPGAAVTDVGSTKAGVVRAAQRILGKGGPFVGSHPMAGGEQKGPQAARADLFDGATCIVTPTPQTPADLTERVEALWRDLGMNVLRMTPAAHDQAVARVSHLPHVLASLLMMLPPAPDLKVAATGFRDATRLAGGDPEMWRDILTTNRKAVLAAIDAFDESMVHLRDLIELGDAQGIEAFLTVARDRRAAVIIGKAPRRRLAME